MEHPVRIIVILVLLGFGVGILSGGDFKNFDVNSVIQKAEQWLNSLDFGPFNIMFQNMKEAFIFAKDGLMKLIEKTQQK